MVLVAWATERTTHIRQSTSLQQVRSKDLAFFCAKLVRRGIQDTLPLQSLMLPEYHRLDSLALVCKDSCTTEPQKGKSCFLKKAQIDIQLAYVAIIT